MNVRRAGVVGLMCWSVAQSALAVTNSCSDPYWADTLRCKAHPAETPQPSPPPPATAAQIGEYTRVPLVGDLGIRCLDGTRPIVYVDPAVNGPSSRWLISLTGGGSCSAQDLDGNGSFESGQQCASLYADPGEADEMGTATKPATKNLGNGPGNSQGILKPDPAINPVFAQFNRVRVEKCGYDRHSGRAVHPGVVATAPGGGTVTFTLFNQGQKIVLMALDALRGSGVGQAGLSFAEFVNDGIGGVTTTPVVLPSLEDASQVLFVGHSGAANGLYANADRFADHLRAWSGFHGDVRVVHDAQFMPGAENEAAFDTMAVAGLFDQDFNGISNVLGPYNGQSYYTQSSLTETFRSWLEAPSDALATVADASCVAAHAMSGDDWKCRAALHVHLHHETTPNFVREDFSDPNLEHTNGGIGYPVAWGPYGNYAHCAQVGFTPCPPLMAVGPGSPYALRLASQAAHFVEGYATLSELSLGRDGSGPLPTSYLWMPNCHTHESTYDDVQFYESRLIAGRDMPTLRTLLQEFVAAPASGRLVSRVDGAAGYLSECGPPLFNDDFD